MKELFILKCDADGTMRSVDKSFGVAVETEAEAKRFVSEFKYGYSNSYEKIVVFDNVEEALDYDDTLFQQNLKQEFGKNMKFT